MGGSRIIERPLSPHGEKRTTSRYLPIAITGDGVPGLSDGGNSSKRLPSRGHARGGRPRFGVTERHSRAPASAGGTTAGNTRYSALAPRRPPKGKTASITSWSAIRN